MKGFFAANIMRTAICVVLLSILPAIVIVVGTGVALYKDDLESTHLQGERLVRSLALRQEQMTQVMETFVLMLGRLREVRDADMAATATLLRNLLATSPEYADIFLLDKEGNVLASASPEGRALHFSDSPFFKDVVARQTFTVGKAAFAPATGGAVLYFAAPVALNGEEGSGVICVALNLFRYAKLLSGQALSENAAVFLVDEAGTVMLASPGAGLAAEGEKLEETLWDAVRRAEAPAGRVTVRTDGHFAGHDVIYQRLSLRHSDSPYFSVVYVQSSQSVHAYARDLLFRYVGLFATVILLSLAVATGLYYVTVRRPWRVLLDAATRVGGGELGVRVPEKGVGGEIGMLSREFNAMADALDRREKELSAARDQVELSRTAKSEFLANMSHEIRTSMNAILGMAYLVLKTELTIQQHGYISKLLAAAKALLRVINDILDFSKMEAGKMAMESISFSLRRILGAVRSETAARLSEKQLGFDLRVSHGVPDTLIGDPLRLSQALMVLVDEALNKSERGTLSLCCSIAERNEEFITLQFAVRDAGVGLTPVQLAEMRELFANETEDAPTTLDKTRLRLAIANRLFRMMHGRVEVSSIFGQGVLFTATARFGCAAKDASLAPLAGTFFEGKRALVVDAGEVSRQDLVDVLIGFGFAVECVPGVPQALTALENAREDALPFAVMFVDWRPSVADMASQVGRLREAPLSLPPLVLTTASGRPDLPESLDEIGIDALLPKPVNASLVLDTLMNLLGMQSGTDLVFREESAAEVGNLANIRVLLAEDNAINRQIAGEILESEGVHLTCVNNGEEVVSLLTESGPGVFDFVLMDLQMPVMDGFTATRQLRRMEAFHPLRLPIIAMTAHSDSAERASCFAAGMNDHTGKPIIIENFLATLGRWLPPRKEDAAALAETIPLLRALCGRQDAASRSEMEALLQKVSPLLQEGRAEILRSALLEEDAAVSLRALAALEALVAELNGGGAV